MKKIKICIYVEFYHFFGGFLYKNIGTGLLSSYKNQKKMLDSLGLQYVEKWDDSCDILQINTPYLKSVYLMKRAKRLGKPVIVWAHVTAEDMRGVFWFSNILSPILRHYYKYAYNLADVILCPSEYTRKLLIADGLPPEKVVAQSNGVDINKFSASVQKREEGRKEYGLSKMTVGTVALAIPRKGIDTFVMLGKNFPNMQFMWYGSIYNALMAKPLPKNLPSNIHFTGYVKDIFAAFNSIDIFVFLSYEENEGMVVLEAAALGLPILVRDIPVYEGWLVHNENCLKAKSDEEFKTAIKQLSENSELRTRLGHNARLLAESRSFDVLSKRFENLYQRLLEK
jgi:1,2-diacylglycerol-3-alpha-glucose alpha-1,2-glucosyltransferase